MRYQTATQWGVYEVEVEHGQIRSVHGIDLDPVPAGIAETLVYVAFGFWAISFAMSRESQRLERRLGVGTR